MTGSTSDLVRWAALALIGWSAGCAMSHEAPDVPERCDRLDDDGDGRIDEGLPLSAVGERIRVRADEGSTGECSRCRWALSALTPTGTGMALVMRVYSEGDPVANVFSRRLGPEGRPVAAVDRLFDAASLEWFPSVHSERGAVVIGTNAQGATGRGPMLATLDPDGMRALGPTIVPLPPGRAPGTSATPQVATMPDGTFRTALECGADVCLAAIDEDGDALGAWALSDLSSLLPRRGSRLGSPVIAHRASRVGVAVIQVHGGEPARPELLFVLLDADGAVVREHRIELPLPDFELVPIDTARIVADDEGFLVTILRRDCVADGRNGRWVARFGGEGELLEGPVNHEPAACYYGADLSVQRRSGPGLLMSGTRSLDPAAGIDGHESFVAHLDARGRLGWATALESPLHSVLELADGRVMAALSTRWQPGEANPIDIAELRCSP